MTNIDKKETEINQQKPVVKQTHPIRNAVIQKIVSFVVAMIIICITVTLGINYVKKNYLAPVDVNDATEHEIIIPRGSGLSSISEKLYEEGFIRNATVFKLFVDLSDNTAKLKSGKHTFRKNMTLSETMNELLIGTETALEETITIHEDWTVRMLADYLVNEKQFDFTIEQFYEAANVANYVTELSDGTVESDYELLTNIPKEQWECIDGRGGLEGFLFPETYRVFADSTPEQIIKKLLGEFDKRYSQAYKVLGEEAGMSTYEVITLASVIQKEARLKSEFPKIAGVFANRMDIDMALGSCATVQYVLDDPTHRWSLTDEEMAIDSPYNTYKYPGLPVGPICSPGLEAIKAALAPDRYFLGRNRKALYFVLKDPERGEHVFNYSLEGHNRDKAKYEEEWKKLEQQ